MKKGGSRRAAGVKKGEKREGKIFFFRGVKTSAKKKDGTSPKMRWRRDRREGRKNRVARTTDEEKKGGERKAVNRFFHTFFLREGKKGGNSSLHVGLG